MFTNGVAKYLRRVNLGDYQHAEASAEISWSAVDRPAEAEQLAAQAATLARSQVEQQLGLHAAEDYGKPAFQQALEASGVYVKTDGGKAAGNPTVVTVPTPAGAPSLADATPTNLPDPAGMLDHYLTSVTPTPLQNDKAALAASMTNGGSGEIVTSKGGVPVSQLRAAFGTGRKPKSATQVVEAGPTVTAPTQPLASPAPTPEPSTVGPNLMSSEPTPVEVWEALPTAKTYTVAELGRACSDAVVRLKNDGDAAPSVTVQRLVGKFGKATNAIPEDKRGDFLAELAVLEPQK